MLLLFISKLHVNKITWNQVSHCKNITSLGLDRAKQKGSFDFPQNSIKTPSGDFKQVYEEFLGVLVTWCHQVGGVLRIFCDSSRLFEDFQKISKHHQVTSTPKTLRKLAWNDLTVFWSNFEWYPRFLFQTVQALNITKSSKKSSSCRNCHPKTLHISWSVSYPSFTSEAAEN